MFTPFSDEQLMALEAKFGRIAVVRGKAPKASRWAAREPEPPYELVFRKPIPAETDAFEAATHNDAQKPAALRNLAKATVVAISWNGEQKLHDGDRRGKVERELRAFWDKLRDEYPGPHLAAQEELLELMGAGKEEQEK